MTSQTRTWEITDPDGSNRRTVTLAEFKAEIAARAAMAKPIMDAVRRNDMRACADAQAAMRARFA